MSRDEEFRSLNLDAHQRVTKIRTLARALGSRQIEAQCDNLVDTLKIIDEIWPAEREGDA